eukprot:347234-Chlamydomonas_euryale.AAC.3
MSHTKCADTPRHTHPRTPQAKLLDAMARNDAADELERIGRKDFIVDVRLLSELQAASDARVEGLRTSIVRTHLELEVLAARVQAVCWEGMSVAKVWRRGG